MNGGENLFLVAAFIIREAEKKYTEKVKTFFKKSTAFSFFSPKSGKQVGSFSLFLSRDEIHKEDVFFSSKP